MSELGNKQKQFTALIAELILYVHTQLPGFRFTFGDAFRCQECTHGHKDSLHRKRLAIDLNLFVDGEYITCTGDSVTVNRHITLWQHVGEFAELIGLSWGGRFNDYNHFSLEYKGMK